MIVLVALIAELDYVLWNVVRVNPVKMMNLPGADAAASQAGRVPKRLPGVTYEYPGDLVLLPFAEDGVISRGPPDIHVLISPRAPSPPSHARP